MKKCIASNFSQAAAEYDKFALVQKKSIVTMGELLPLPHSLPSGPVLEIGCGTGRLSRKLSTIFQNRSLIFTDMASGMIEQCRRHLPQTTPRHIWLIMDGESPAARGCALIVSSLTMQWFNDPASALGNIRDILQDGGQILFSYIGVDSCPQWRQICAELQLPCTINPLPDNQYLLPLLEGKFKNIKLWNEDIDVEYTTARDFFYSLKRTGAATQLKGQRLNSSEMRKLLKGWQLKLDGSPLIMTYNIQYLRAVK
ncbi:methyltransferase domain-containing protein [Desulfobacterota bacterium M19]